MRMFGYVLSTPLWTVLLVFVLSLFIYTWRTRFARGFDLLTSLAYGFLGAGITTGFMVSVVLITGKVPRGYTKTPLYKALMWGLLVAVCGAILFYGLRRLAQIKKAVDDRNKMDLSKVALKILAGDKNYFRPMTVPSKEASWREFARAANVDSIKKNGAPPPPKAMGKIPPLIK